MAVHRRRGRPAHFAVTQGSADELRRLRAAIRERIYTLEDQVRLYPTNTQTFAERYIIGARTVGERADCWIVR